MNDQVDPRELRVGDAEREHVFGILQRAVGRGLLDIDDFTARADSVQAATTRGQLNAVLVDLPGAQATPDRLELKASCSQPVSRGGDWTVPREVVVRTSWSGADLDFRTARLLHPEVRVTLAALGGSVDLRLPPGAVVDVGGLRVWGSSVTDTRAEQPLHGRPYFVVGGSLRLGSLTIS